jgi:hypothetical protein
LPLILLSLFSAQAQTFDDPWGVKPPPPPPAPIIETPPPPPGSCAALYMADPILNPWGNQLEEPESCDRLATGVWETVPRFQGEIPLDAVEPIHRAPVGVVGSAGQLQPAAAIQPVPRSGGALSMVQHEAGARVLGGVSINRGALRSEQSADYAARSRASDLSVYLPIDLLNESDSLDNIGLTWRVSLRAAEAAEAAIALARPAYDQLNVPGPIVISQMATLLYRAQDKPACLTALKTGQADEITPGCGSGLPALQPYMMVDRGGLAALQAGRGDLDAASIGLQVSLDLGDPTFSGAPGRQGQHLSAEAGVSHPNGDFNLRARGGGRFSHLNDSGISTGFLIASVGGDLLLSDRSDPTAVSMGLSGQVALAETGALPSTTFNLELGIRAPLSDSARFGLGLSWPLVGEETRPLLAITADWLSLAPGG